MRCGRGQIAVPPSGYSPVARPVSSHVGNLRLAGITAGTGGLLLRVDQSPKGTKGRKPEVSESRDASPGRGDSREAFLLSPLRGF